MLNLSVENPLQVLDDNRGWARYRIDFDSLIDTEMYVLGWQKTDWPEHTEAREFLYAQRGWQKGIVKEILQDDVYEVKFFTVRLYRAGFIKEYEEPEVFILETKHFGGIPA